MPADTKRCAFCGQRPRPHEKMIAGPVVAICYRCSIAAPPDAVPSDAVMCSFCGKQAGVVRGHSHAAICATCLALCADIVAENPEHVALPRAAIRLPLWSRLRAWFARL